MTGYLKEEMYHYRMCDSLSSIISYLMTEPIVQWRD